jgi:hypothetical protein
VSTARTALPDVSPNPFFHLDDGSRLRRSLEQGPVNVFGGIASRLADDDAIAILVPLHD